MDEPGLEVGDSVFTPSDVLIKPTLPVGVGAIQAVPLEVVALEDRKLWNEAEELSDVFNGMDIGLPFAVTSLQ